MKVFELLLTESSLFLTILLGHLGEFSIILHFLKDIFTNTAGENENLGYLKIFKWKSSCGKHKIMCQKVFRTKNKFLIKNIRTKIHGTRCLPTNFRTI